ILSEKVEPRCDVSDYGLLLGELQTAFGQKGHHRGFDDLLQRFAFAGGHHEVIRVTDEVDLVTSYFDPAANGPFHSVQRQVGQEGRNDSALWRSFGGREQAAFFPIASFQPEPE